MRLAELSRESGVPVATVKYYLRVGLLHEGERTSATQARYDEAHLARLRLVRALLGVGQLSVAATREVLRQLDEPPASTRDLLAATHRLLQSSTDTDTDVDVSRAEKVARTMGWRVDAIDSTSMQWLAAALAAVDAAGFTVPQEALLGYARAMQEVAEQEIAGVLEDPAEAVRYATLGTVLVEPVLLALRRMAQADASARHFGA